jgi:RHH-type transcriptional regulator, rel operon repressor / antitoxin RelB
MADSTTVTVRLDRGTRKRLDALARTTKRSKSFIAGEAIAAYLDSQEWQLKQIKSGLADLNSGKSASGERVAEWLRSWGGDAELPPPRCK